MVNECQQDAGGLLTWSEKLVVRRRNCDPVTVMELPRVGPLLDPLSPFGGLCRLYGGFRIGPGFVAVGRFQRVALLPKDAGAVIEITNDHSLFPSVSPEPPQEGLFFMRLDGTGLRRLGPATAQGILAVLPDPLGDPPIAFVQYDSYFVHVSPSGRLLAVDDLGPGPAGHDANQVFLLDVQKGTRTQLTHLPPSPPGAAPTCCPFFEDERTIVFFNGPAGGIQSRVTTDGRALEPLPGIEAIPGARVVSQFSVVGSGAHGFALALPGELKRGYGPSDVIRELFLVDGLRLLQLTGFGYPDTGGWFTPGTEPIFFNASADPLGANPAGVCQLFSIGRFGGGLKQLTRFPDDGRRKRGCLAAAPGASCITHQLARGPGGLVFTSSCDPLGRNPNGDQLFTMRTDGSGLRQITSFRGVEELADGGVHVEMSGTPAHSVLPSSSRAPRLTSRTSAAAPIRVDRNRGASL